ncbi:MAG TPA: hypothetical protein VM715_12195, partial [Candidatus Acidoferrum sp.]|nr:hypothetical protein [Candidatus Acidoferrum sp.]
QYATVSGNQRSQIETIALVCGPRGCVRTVPMYRHGYYHGYGWYRGYGYHGRYGWHRGNRPW